MDLLSILMWLILGVLAVFAALVLVALLVACFWTFLLWVVLSLPLDVFLIIGGGLALLCLLALVVVVAGILMLIF